MSNTDMEDMAAAAAALDQAPEQPDNVDDEVSTEPDTDVAEASEAADAKDDADKPKPEPNFNTDHVQARPSPETALAAAAVGNGQQGADDNPLSAPQGAAPTDGISDDDHPFVSREREPVQFVICGISPVRLDDMRLRWDIPKDKVNRVRRHHHVVTNRVVDTMPTVEYED